VVLAVGVLDMGDDLGAFVDEVHAAAEQIAGGAHAGRVGVGQRDVAAAEQAGDLAGVDLVVLALAAVDGPHVEGVGGGEGDLAGGGQVGGAGTGEEGLDGDGGGGGEGGDGLEEGGGVGGEVTVEDDLTLVIEDAEVHGPGVQIDAAVESVRLAV